MPETDPLTAFTSVGRENPIDKIRRIARSDNLSDDIADDFSKVTGLESGRSHYERGGRVKVSPVDPKDGQRAIGFSQIKPSTARSVGVDDPYDEESNIKAGLRYYAQGGNDPIRRRIAYFSGQKSGAVKHYDRTGRIPSGGDFTGTSFKQYIAGTGGAPQVAQDPLTLFTQSKQADPLSTFTQPDIEPQKPAPKTGSWFDSKFKQGKPVPRSYDTRLASDEESRFQQWKQQYAPNDSGADYDLRGAFKAGLTPDPKTGHWPDTFKKPNHPTFSNESMYAVGADATKAGHWQGDRFIPAQGATSRDKSRQVPKGPFAGVQGGVEASRPNLMGEGAAGGQISDADRLRQAVNTSAPPGFGLLPRAAQEAVGEQVAKGAAGITRLASGAIKVAPRIPTLGIPNPLVEKTISPITQPARQALNTAASTMTSGAQQMEKQANRPTVHVPVLGDVGMQDVYNVGGGTIASAPSLALMRLGVPAPVAFGLQSYLEAEGRDAELKDVLKETGVGAATGGLFEIPLPARMALLAKIGAKLGIVGGGTYTIDKITGMPESEARKNAFTNALFSVSGVKSERPEIKAPTQTVPEVLQGKLRGGEIDRALAGREAAVRRPTQASEVPAMRVAGRLRGAEPIELSQAKYPEAKYPESLGVVGPTKPVVGVEEGAKLNRWQHRDFGLVTESVNQAGVGKGRVRVLAEDGTEHLIQRPKGTGAGNQIAVPVRPQPSDARAADEAAQAAENAPFKVVDKRALREGVNEISGNQPSEVANAPRTPKLMAQTPEAVAPEDRTSIETGPTTAKRGAVDVQSDARSVPLADESVSSFTTSQGSTYAVSGESTQRTKSKHLMHDPKDVGLKESSRRTVYVTPEQATEIGAHGTLNTEAKPRVELTNEGIVLTNKYGKGWSQTKRQVIPFSSTPEVGKAPVEFFERGKYHAGNEITKVEGGVSVPQEYKPDPSSIVEYRKYVEGQQRDRDIDQTMALLENKESGEVYDRFTRGTATQNDIEQFRKAANGLGISKEHTEDLIASARSIRIPSIAELSNTKGRTAVEELKREASYLEQERSGLPSRLPPKEQFTDELARRFEHRRDVLYRRIMSLMDEEGSVVNEIWDEASRAAKEGAESQREARISQLADLRENLTTQVRSRAELEDFASEITRLKNEAKTEYDQISTQPETLLTKEIAHRKYLDLIELDGEANRAVHQLDMDALGSLDWNISGLGDLGDALRDFNSALKGREVMKNVTPLKPKLLSAAAPQEAPKTAPKVSEASLESLEASARPVQGEEPWQQTPEEYERQIGPYEYERRERVAIGDEGRLSMLDRNGAEWKTYARDNPSLRSNPQTVVVYRASSGKELNAGDWIYLKRSMARQHLENLADRGEGSKPKIIEREVPLSDIVAGQDSEEFVYSPRSATERSHAEMVRNALKEGKAVPPEVLARYPYLARKYVPPVVSSPEISESTSERETVNRKAESPKTTGIARRVEESRRAGLGQEPPVSGKGIKAADSVVHGRELLAKGRSPERVVEDFQKNGSISADAMALVRAKHEELARTANQAFDEGGQNLNNSKFKAAEKARQDFWENSVRPMQTEWHKTGMAQQGETDIDTGTFYGMYRAFKQHTGKEMTPEQAVKAKELATNVSTADSKVRQTSISLAEELDKAAGLKDLSPDIQSSIQRLVDAEKPTRAERRQRTKKTLDDEAAMIKTNLAAAFQKAKGQSGVQASGLARLDPEGEITKLAIKYAKNRVKSGVVDAAELIDNVHAMLKDFVDVTRREVAEAIAGVGSTSKPRTASDWMAAKGEVKKGIKSTDAAKSFEDLRNRMTNGDKPTPEDARAIWLHMRKYVDRGMEFPDARYATATDLGASPEQIARAITQQPKAKRLSDQMYRQMSDRRNAIAQNEAWVKSADTPVYRKFISSLPDFWFGLKTFGHGTVGMVTHAGKNIFLPTRWAEYFPNFVKQYGLAVNKGYHERMMRDLENSPNFIEAKRAGLANDPHRTFDDYQKNSLAKLFGRAGLAGARGFDSLKLLRQDLFDAHWNKMPDSLKTPKMAELLATEVNHSTGAMKINLPKSASTVFFAPRLEASRWAWVIGDNVKAGKTFAEWKRSSPEERYHAKMVAKRDAEFVATYAALLALNQGVLIATNSKDRVNLTDPAKADWMRFKVLGRTVEPTGGLISMLDFMGKLGNAAFGKRDPREGRFEKAGKATMQYGRGKLSPIASTATDVLTQSDFAGRPLPFSSDKGTINRPRYSWPEYLITQQTPIPVGEAARDAYKTMKDRGMDESVIRVIFQGAAVGTLSGGTGVRIGEEYHINPRPQGRVIQ